MNLDTFNYDFIPKRIPFREKEEKTIITEIKKFLKFKATRNISITGSPGIGKTLISKKIKSILEEELDGNILYFNLWLSNSNEMIRQLAGELGILFNSNLTKNELLDRINAKIKDEKSFLILFLDEIDKVDDEQLIYLLEEKLNAMFIFITNNETFLSSLDNRVKSRLNLINVVFNPYKEDEISEILKERMELINARYENEAIDFIVRETFNKKDLRFGIFVLREMIIGEERINLENIKKFMENLNIGKAKKDLVKEDLEIVYDFLLIEIKNKKDRSMSLYNKFIQNFQNPPSYRTFYRKLEKLEKKGLIIMTKESDKGVGMIVELKQ